MRFYRAFAAGRCQPSHVSLFRRDGGASDLASHLLEQDLVYVGGGSLISLLGTWGAHGIDVMLRNAWEAGVVMTGLSAGSLCWFDHGMTAFHGESKGVKGMGFLPFSNAVHYDDKPERRAAFLTAIADGMPAGYGTGDGAALHFVGTELARRRDLAPARPGVPCGAGRGRRDGDRAGDAVPGNAGPCGAGPCRLNRRRPPTILAMGGGGFTAAADPALDELVLRLAEAPCPRLCLLPTAGGDSEYQIRRFYETFGDRLCEPSHVSLFRLGRRPIPLREHLLAQDAIYVGGGSMVNLLAIWRAQGLDDDPARRMARRRGAGRAERRVDVLVPLGRHDVVGRADRRARPRLPARLELGPPRQRAGPPPGLPRRRVAPARSRPAGRSTTARR